LIRNPDVHPAVGDAASGAPQRAERSADQPLLEGAYDRNAHASTSRAPRAPWAARRGRLAGAVLALKTRHTGLEHAARQELTELALDELREACPVAGLRHRAQEGLQVLGDDLMEHGVLGVTRGR
jgi:hypothetical protein